MNMFLLGVAVFLALLIVVKGFATANPRTLARTLKLGAGTALLAFAGLMALTGRWLVAVPLAMFGASLLGKDLSRLGRSIGGMRSPSGRRSTVRSAALEMELDHDTGIMSGRVLAGSFEGSDLARLSIEDLKGLWREIRNDQESRALLEAYLDRRDAFWREDLNGDASPGQAGPAAAGAMTEKEAYQILGLEPGAGESEIRDAHRRLMLALHPDRGGSTFLAAKINEAKDRLIGKHRTRSGH